VALVLLVVASACNGEDTGTADRAATTPTAVAIAAVTTTTASASAGAVAPGTSVAEGDGGAGDGAAAVPPDVQQVSRQLVDADLDCLSTAPLVGVDGPAQATRCDLLGGPAYVYRFVDDGARDAFIAGNGVIDCTFVSGTGAAFDYVVAERVIIRPEDDGAARPIATALSGEVRTIACEPPAG
jgi:hypothetical protein